MPTTETTQEATAWVLVESSNLHSLCYERLTGTLFVRFWRGKEAAREPDRAVYRYDAVPATLYDGLREATSVGAYFAAQIKNAHAWTRLELLP